MFRARWSVSSLIENVMKILAVQLTKLKAPADKLPLPLALSCNGKSLESSCQPKLGVRKQAKRIRGECKIDRKPAGERMSRRLSHIRQFPARRGRRSRRAAARGLHHRRCFPARHGRRPSPLSSLATQRNVALNLHQGDPWRRETEKYRRRRRHRALRNGNLRWSGAEK